jgi:hypothetical protein
MLIIGAGYHRLTSQMASHSQVFTKEKTFFTITEKKISYSEVNNNNDPFL